MSEQRVTGHTLKDFDKALSEVNALVEQAAGKACGQLDAALRALDEEDVEAARQVIRRDREIDALELELDDAVLHIIARQQPVAGDLRDLLAVNKMMTDIERIGDEARRLAHLTLIFYDEGARPPNSRLLTDVQRLGRFVGGMLEQAMRAFDEDDVAQALEVLHLGETLHDEMKSALRRLSTYLLEDARTVGHIVQITLGLRAVEGIGSHAAYVARHVIFLLEGKDVRHEPVEAVARILGVAGPLPS